MMMIALGTDQSVPLLFYLQIVITGLGLTVFIIISWTLHIGVGFSLPQIFSVILITLTLLSGLSIMLFLMQSSLFFYQFSHKFFLYSLFIKSERRSDRLLISPNLNPHQLGLCNCGYLINLSLVSSLNIHVSLISLIYNYTVLVCYV